MTRAVVLTGGPGAGKSSVLQAFTTLLDNAAIEHGAIESEQLAWGTPWLAYARVHEQLAVLCRMQSARARVLASQIAALPGIDLVLPLPRSGGG